MRYWGQNLIEAINGYCLPRFPEALFVSPVAVHPDGRGKSIARSILIELLKRVTAQRVARSALQRDLIIETSDANDKHILSAETDCVFACVFSPLVTGILCGLSPATHSNTTSQGVSMTGTSIQPESDPDDTAPDATFIQATRAWIKTFVVDLNLCPFARKSVQTKRIRYTVSPANNAEDILLSLIDDMRALDELTHIETGFLICPGASMDFLQFNDLVYLGEQLLKEQGWEGTYQIVAFHPAFQFADTDANDPSNFTNRSPYPMFHLLRESSVTRAVEATCNIEDIPAVNTKTLNALGLQVLSERWHACVNHPASTC